MREMHKWKDKVELALDNRQIFFLFFGLSVVGCFVFALGVMVGRRVDMAPSGEVAAIGQGDSLALLDAESAKERLSFEEGLSTPATEGLPSTRDPATVGLDEEAKADDATLASAAPKPAGPAGAKGATMTDDEPAAAKGAKGGKGAKGAKGPKGAKKSATKSKSKPKPKKLDGRFTLQMKAFTRPDDAEAFAAKLRANGHAVRVEASEVKGRIWHRVRVGAFKTWSEGLEAKTKFESTESVIAYVVRM